MKRGTTIVITKRDGTLERFSSAKLRSCLARVLADGGEPRELAEPLTRAITEHLRQSNDDALPTSEYVYRCVRAVLKQTGQKRTAHVLAEHRRQRALLRRRIRVYDPARPEETPCRWRKGAVAETLQQTFDVRQGVARFLAARVEERVFDLGYRLVSTSFVGELMRNEMLAWGLPFERVRREPGRAVPDSSAVGGEPPRTT